MIEDEKVNKVINKILKDNMIDTAEQFIKFQKFEISLNREVTLSNIRDILLLMPRDLERYVNNVKRLYVCTKKQEKLIVETQRKLKNWINMYEGDTIKECYKYLLKESRELKGRFKDIKDNKCKENIIEAVKRVDNIDLKNSQKREGYVIEEYPYTQEQINMICDYKKNTEGQKILNTYMQKLKKDRNNIKDGEDEFEG